MLASLLAETYKSTGLLAKTHKSAGLLTVTFYRTHGGNRQAICPPGRVTQVYSTPGRDNHGNRSSGKDTKYIVRDHGVFRTLYCPDFVKKKETIRAWSNRHPKKGIHN